MSETTETPTNGTQTPPAGGNSSDLSPADGDTNAISLSRDAFNERLARAKNSAVAELLKDLGLESADALKSLVATARERADAEKSEAERAQAQVASLEQKLADAEKRAGDMEQARRADRLNAAILAAAKSATDPSDVVAWANTDGQAHLDGALDEDGAPVAAKVEALVAACKKTKPHWFRAGGPGSPSNSGGRPPDPDRDVLERARQDLERTVRF